MKLMHLALWGACLSYPAVAQAEADFDAERGFYVAVRGYGSIGIRTI